MNQPSHRSFRTPRFLAILTVVVTALAVLVMPQTMPAEDAEAAVGSNFQPGNIVSDAAFFNGGAMSAAAVQSFLDSRQRGCKSGYTCLNGYRQATPAMSADRYCNAIPARNNASAAEIIATVAAACGISQRVLIVLLEKEQSLVTSSSPSSRQYSSATGFACPDTAPCDSSYGGFFYQVYYAARQFDVYRLNPGSFNYRAGQNNTILWNPNRDCGTSTVYIQNQATAGLYNYTPYRPNAAAMQNLYGTGDSCSSYGNRNFWRIWSDWFGSPTGRTGSPYGAFDSITATREGASIRGWAIDPDTTDPIRVHVYVNGRGYGSYLADASRPDVGRAYPGYGDQHGFNLDLELAEGNNEVCVYAINRAGTGGTTLLQCRNVTVAERTYAPVGALDPMALTDNQVRISGWAADPDTSDPIRVHIYVNGRGTQSIAADLAREEVGNQYPELGSEHGFDTTLELSEGSNTVCAYAIDAVGDNGNTRLGCETVTVNGP